MKLHDTITLKHARIAWERCVGHSSPVSVIQVAMQAAIDEAAQGSADELTRPQAENERLRARVGALDKGLRMAIEWNWITPEGIPSVTVDFIDQLLSPTPDDDGEEG